MPHRRRKMKGLPGPRSRRGTSEIGEPADLPIDHEPPPEQPDELKIVDQRLAPRPYKCPRCYGQGRVPGYRHCGHGRDCPDCGGSGTLVPPEIEVPQRSYDDQPRPMISLEKMQTIEPGDVDYDDAAAGDVELLEPPRPRRRVIKMRKRDPKKKRRRATKKSNIPPWELICPHCSQPKPADAVACSECDIF